LLTWRTAKAADAGLLAELNRQLIEDEAHRNPMSLSELRERMLAMLTGDYTATLFERDEQVVAYALWRDEPEYRYLRHFYVDRTCRRQGVGRDAIRLLLDEVFPPGKRIRVDVLIENRSGLEFWRAIGFEDYAMTLEMERGAEAGVADSPPNDQADVALRSIAHRSIRSSSCS
jgi:ribosomal protein S18 acetylase RimI-like enzyme